MSLLDAPPKEAVRRRPPDAGARPGEATEQPDRLASVSRLVDEAITFLRTVNAAKSHNVGRSAHALLFPLSGRGPMRLTALAESVHADTSTISRQIAELVRDDFVRREADPDDGRACLLVVTDKGHAAAAALRDSRTASLSRALSDWSSEEITSFTDHLQRFSISLAESLSRPVGSTHPDAAASHLSAQEH